MFWRMHGRLPEGFDCVRVMLAKAAPMTVGLHHSCWVAWVGVGEGGVKETSVDLVGAGEEDDNEK